MTLTCEDNNSKLVVIVTVADAENHFDDSLVQIWKLMFGHKFLFRFRLGPQGLFKILKLSGKILKLKFGHYFAADD